MICVTLWLVEIPDRCLFAVREPLVLSVLQEIRDVADEMLRQCKAACPVIFAYAGPACVRGPCPEGEKSCGHSRRKEFLTEADIAEAN